MVARKAAILDLLHQKARKALVTAAQDAAYSGYIATHDDHEPSAQEADAQGHAHELKERIDRISLAVQSRFSVEEMCLIDTKGAEVSRIVGAEVAHDLATDEADAIFFRPGFEAEPRSVHISPPYLSPDADKWVIAYVTPVVVDGEKKAILHYEHGLEVYQAAMNRGLEDDRLHVVAVDPAGWIVSDSRQSIPIIKTGDVEGPEGYFQRFSWQGHDLREVKQRLGGEASSGAGEWETAQGRFSVAFTEVEDWTLLAFELQ